MACCLALALAIGALRTVWFRVVRGTEPPRAGFAPPARRPAPFVSESATPEPDAAPSVASDRGGSASPGPRGRRGRAGSRAAVDLLLGAVLGAGAYAALLTLLVTTGAVVATGDHPARTAGLITTGAVVATGDHPARTAGLITAAVVAAALRARRGPGRGRGSGTGSGRARGIAGAGAAWSLLSVLDMHVTGLVPEHLVGPVADVALHGPGFLALTVGGAALLAGPRYLSTLSPGGTR